LGSSLKGGEVIELRSDLGGGKTTFVRGLATGAGSKDNVASPTFTLSRIYNAKKLQIHHFDFYRLNDAGILADQLAESINDNNTVVVVEWADIVADVLPKYHMTVEFLLSAASPDERQVRIAYPEEFEPKIKKTQSLWEEVRP
jgi:tRNA threonylcarbamoyladenosine biosynthesis protein TsaE